LAASALAAAENQLRSLKEVQTVQADLAISKTENDLKKAELDLDDTILTAPAAGMVVSHDAHAGEFVQAGQRVALFIPEAPRTSIEIQVDETNAGRIAPGQPASVTSPAYPGRVFTGKVERLGAIVDAQRGSFPIVIALDRFEPDLLPESSVSAQITTGRATGVLLLEQRFILREGEKASVYIEENGRAKKVPVSVRDLGSGLFECREGLKSGQSVLLPQGLKDGLKIKLKPLPE
jgi:cobalt-zinc-cadmium efflux system membrane fusion protein